MDQPIIITPGDFDHPQVKALLTAHLEGMRANSPPGHVFALDWSGLQRPEINFFTAWQGDVLQGMGALKTLGDGSGEIKSMRTAASALRQGVGEAILLHLIATARQRGLKRLSLETGTGPAFAAALALYHKHGFVAGGPFADYEKSAFNQFLHLVFK
jgi:putative acetyltransferase